MERRTFLRNLMVGAAIAPVVALAKEKPAPPSAMRYVGEIPREAGAVKCMTIWDDHLWLGCANGLWVMPMEAKK